MFPEGRLNHTRDPMVSIRSGAAMVAERAGVPIVPLYIDGSPYRREVWSPLIMPAHVAITFGTPIFPKPLLGDVANGDVLAATDKANGRAAEESEDSNGNGLVGSEENGKVDGEEMTSAEALILQWGQQVVTLAGHPDFKVELVSKRKRRARTKS